MAASLHAAATSTAAAPSAAEAAHHHVIVTAFDFIDRRVVGLPRRGATQQKEDEPKGYERSKRHGRLLVSEAPLPLAAKLANHAREIRCFPEAGFLSQVQEDASSTPPSQLLLILSFSDVHLFDREVRGSRFRERPFDAVENGA
jgi:hypothetical protein